jgi:hypothetical protein
MWPIAMSVRGVDFKSEVNSIQVSLCKYLQTLAS